MEAPSFPYIDVVVMHLRDPTPCISVPSHSPYVYDINVLSFSFMTHFLIHTTYIVGEQGLHFFLMNIGQVIDKCVHITV